MTSYKYSGKWKTTGFVVGNTKWHSGHIAISCDVSGFWRCSLEFNEKRPVTKDFQVSKHGDIETLFILNNIYFNFHKH